MLYNINAWKFLSDFVRRLSVGKAIFIVSTYYHTLISCLKQIKRHSDSDILVTQYIPCGEQLASRLQHSGLFDNVLFVADIRQYEPKNKFDYLFNLHRKNAEKIEEQLDFSFYDYDEINVYHDDIWAARYFKDRRIKYRLCEDALDSFKSLSHSPFAFMLPRFTLKSYIDKVFHFGYAFCGSDNCTVCVEVNEANGVELKGSIRNKIVEYPRADLFKDLSVEDKLILSDIFLCHNLVTIPENAVLLLTQPLFVDGIVSTQEEQMNIFSRAINNAIDSNQQLVVKPHPRDILSYEEKFPDALILDKNMPVEMFAILAEYNFAKIITYNSTALKSLRAKEYIKIEEDKMSIPVIDKIDSDKKVIPVFLSISNEYYKYFSALLVSLSENLSSNEYLDIVVFSTEDLNETNTICTERIKKRYGNFNLRYINVSEMISGWKPYVRGHVTIMTYLRFLAPFLMKDYDKAIYLDGDTLVIDDIGKLFAIDIGDNFLGAARDAAAAGIYADGRRADIVNLFDNILQLSDPFSYFQAGVLIVNLKKFRESFKLNELMRLCERNTWYFVDQDVLNYLCKDNVFRIDMSWNVESKSALAIALNFAPQDIKDEYEKARKTPNIIHFAGADKPWKNPSADFAEYFLRYAKMSPLYDSITAGFVTGFDAPMIAMANKKLYFRCTTPLHLFNAINIKNSLYKNNYATAVLTGDIDWGSMYTGLKEAEIFNDIILSDSTRDVTAYNKISENDKATVAENPEKFLINNGFTKELDAIKKNGPFTDLFFSLDSKNEWMLYYYVAQKSKFAVDVHLYEEGTASYIFDHYDYIKRCDFVPRVANIKPYLNSICEYLVYDPLLICVPDFKFKAVKMPDIKNNNEDIKKITLMVYGKPSLPKERFIYFDSPGFDQKEDYCSIDILEEIAKIVGKENIIVKYHPRTKSDRYAARGFKVMTATSPLWEANCFDAELSDKVFLSDMSTAALNCYNIFGIKSRIINLHRLNTMSKNLFLTQKGAQKINNKLVENKSPLAEYIRSPRNIDELRELLRYLKGNN